MRFIDSFGHSPVFKAAAKAVVEGGLMAAVLLMLAGMIWRDSVYFGGIKVGVGASWFATSVSISWLLWAKNRGMKAFWWAFGGGMALRASGLAILAVWGLGHKFFSLEALLLSYVFSLLVMLLCLEFRHLRLS